MINNRTYSSIFTFISIGLVIIMIINPSQCFEAASSGLHLWYSVVVPSLLPFFIISEIMVSCGGAALIGRHLSSMMRPLFGQPGSAALAVVMGFCSGFPSGAALTASLRQAGLVSRDEASRLVAFTNNAGPLYIIVAVSTVLLDMPQAAWLLLAAHYGINLLIGICLGRRRLGKNTINTSIDTALYSQESTAFNHSPGALLKNAAKNAATNVITAIFIPVFIFLFLRCLFLFLSGSGLEARITFFLILPHPFRNDSLP